MLNRIFHTIVMLLAFLALHAQGHLSLGRVTPIGGLSNSFVTGMAVDDYGYIWVATESGLNRITGSWCSIIPTAEDGSTQNILSLYHLSGQGVMLIGLEDGLCIYDYKKGSRRRMGVKEGLLKYSLNNIAAAADGGVWLVYGNGQLQHIDFTSMKIRTQKLRDYRSSRCVMDDGAGHIYIGHSQHGMSIVRLSDGKTTHYAHKNNDPNSLPGNNVRCIVRDGNGRIWIGTDHGLALFKSTSGTFTKVRHRDAGYDDNVYDIHQMCDGSIWVANDMGGVNMIDVNDTRSSSEIYYSSEHISSSSINVRAVIQDEFGNIWLGNHSTGVDFISAQKSPFNVFANDIATQATAIPPVYAIAANTDGSYWLGCEDELILWDGGMVRKRWQIHSMANREHSFPRCLMADNDGCIWLGMEDEGVFRFNIAGSRFQRIDIGIAASDIHTFAQDADGRIWIGSEFGVYSYLGGKVREENFINKITRNAPATGFMWLNNGDILISTLGAGLYVINTDTHKYKSLKTANGLPSNKINQFIPDRRQGVWLATTEGLVHIADPSRMKGITVYNLQNGLAGNHIRAVQQDDRGRIWVSTFNGISCLNISDRRFHNYDYFDDRHLNGFASGAVAKDTNGTICFGATGGLCSFNPDDFDDIPQVSDVQIIRCETYSPIGSNTEVTKLFPDDKGRISTSYRHNTLRLSFTLRNYAQIGNEEYSYMMKGMDNKWYYIDGDQDVVFRGLQPGSYTFILRAKLKSQNWKDATETQLAITIRPPFWRTWWAYALYILMLSAIGWYIARSYKRKVALRASLRLERQESMQKQNLNEERMRFFTNITHELRTPLTLILGPLEDLADDTSLPLKSRKKVSMIQKSAERLRSLISDILEFRKTETQNRRLTVARGDIGSFVKETCLNYQELFRNPDVQFSCSVADGIPMVYFDSEVIATILSNLLSNAIKYTERGSITTTVSKNKGMVSITVADTGYGIKADALPHIFEQYYQAKGSHQASGTGIGLALVKSLAQLHEGHLTVDSHEGKGSTFTLMLSTANTYPGALHKEDVPQQATVSVDSIADNDIQGEDTWENPLLLIVEDNADIRQYISDSFADEFRILQAENGEQGLAMARQSMPDIIVSDIMMPKMDGIEFTQQLKNDIRTSHIPIILLTAKTTDRDKEEGYDRGADSYLTKPFTAKLLGKRIHNLLAARRRLAEYITATRTDSKKEKTPATSQIGQLGPLDQEFLDKLKTVINDNIMNQDIDMPFLTDRMAMSHSTFYRKVKALTGITAKEYVRKIRLQRCYQLLQSGRYNVNEAAMLTGFHQMAHFRETFKNEFGILPSEVLKKQKGDTPDKNYSANN